MELLLEGHDVSAPSISQEEGASVSPFHNLTSTRLIRFSRMVKFPPTLRLSVRYMVRTAQMLQLLSNDTYARFLSRLMEH